MKNLLSIFTIYYSEGVCYLNSSSSVYRKVKQLYMSQYNSDKRAAVEAGEVYTDQILSKSQNWIPWDGPGRDALDQGYSTQI